MEITKLRLTDEELTKLGLEPAQLRCRVCALTIADAQLEAIRPSYERLVAALRVVLPLAKEGRTGWDIRWAEAEAVLKEVE